MCLKANQNKPLSWNQPELSIPAADQKDRSSGNENDVARQKLTHAYYAFASYLRREGRLYEVFLVLAKTRLI